MPEQKNIELYHASFFRLERKHDEERAGYIGIYLSSPRGEGFVEIKFGKGSRTKIVRKVDAKNLRIAIQNHAPDYNGNTIEAYCNGPRINLIDMTERYTSSCGFNIPAEAALLRPVGPIEMDRITSALENCRDNSEPRIVLMTYQGLARTQTRRHITRDNSAAKKLEREEKLKKWEAILR